MLSEHQGSLTAGLTAFFFRSSSRNSPLLWVWDALSCKFLLLQQPHSQAFENHQSINLFLWGQAHGPLLPIHGMFSLLRYNFPTSFRNNVRFLNFWVTVSVWLFTQKVLRSHIKISTIDVITHFYFYYSNFAINWYWVPPLIYLFLKYFSEIHFGCSMISTSLVVNYPSVGSVGCFSWFCIV